MPNFAAKMSSAYLSSDAIQEFLAALPSVTRELYGNRNLTVYYGWDCNLHPDLTYKPMGVPLDVFPYFIEDSVDHRIFEIGRSDLIIESPDAKVKILICHESDIHLDGTDDEAIHSIAAQFPNLEFRTAEEWKSLHADKPSE